MNEHANLHRKMWDRVKTVCDDNDVIILTQTDINDIIVEFKLNLPKWDNLESRYVQSIASGTAVQKNIYWGIAAKNISRWGTRLHVQAHKDGLFSLESLINKSKSELMHQKVLSSYNEMVAIKDALKSNISHFTVQKFIGTVVTGLESDLSNLFTEMNKPALESKVSYDLQNQLDELSTEIETQVSDIVSLIVSEFEESKPEMTSNLILANKIGQSQSHRYTGINGLGTIGELPLTGGYTLTILSTPNKVIKFDLLGAYSLKSQKPGLSEIVLKNPQGAEVSRKTVKFISGTMLTINWTL